MNEVSIIINGVKYDAMEGLHCYECVFDEACDIYCSNLCSSLGVSNCGFKKSDKKFEV